MKRLRITHVVPTLDPSRGGPSRSVRGLARAQAEFVDSVEIITGGQPDEYKSDLENFHLRSQPLLQAPFSIPSRKLYRLLRQSIVQADIVHLHSIWNGTTTCAARLGRQLGKTMILSPRGMLDQHNVQRRARLKRLYLLAERANLAAMAAFHFLDDTERDGCSWLRETQQVPCLIQPNGLDIAQLNQQLSQTSTGRFASVVSDPTAKHLVFLGRLNVIKGLELQVQSLAALMNRGFNVHLHLIGPDDGVGDSLERLASDLNVSTRVHRHGPIYEIERLRWLQEADAVLLTSHYECNSVTSAETLAVGGALIATDTCHLDGPAKAGAAMVTLRDVTSLVDAISSLLGDESDRIRLRGKASEYATRHLEWRALAQQMVNFYQQLMHTDTSCVG